MTEKPREGRMWRFSVFKREGENLTFKYLNASWLMSLLVFRGDHLLGPIKPLTWVPSHRRAGVMSLPLPGRERPAVARDWVAGCVTVWLTMSVVSTHRATHSRHHRSTGCLSTSVTPGVNKYVQWCDFFFIHWKFLRPVEILLTGIARRPVWGRRLVYKKTLSCPDALIVS